MILGRGLVASSPVYYSSIRATLEVFLELKTAVKDAEKLPKLVLAEFFFVCIVCV